MAVIVDAVHLFIDELFETLQYPLELFWLIETVVVLVHDDDLPKQVTQGKDSLLLQLGHIVEEVVLLELLYAVLHLGDGLDVGTRESADC